MSVTVEQVQKIATLARLRFSEDEQAQLVGQLNRILSYMEKLNELDTEQVEPLQYVFEQDSAGREDRVEERVTHEEAMQNAPDTDGVFFKVPKVIG